MSPLLVPAARVPRRLLPGLELLLEEALRVAGSGGVLDHDLNLLLCLPVGLAAIITQWDLFVLTLARRLLVDLLANPGGVQAQLLQLLVGQLPGGRLWLGIRPHEGKRVKERLQLGQLVLVDREEDVVLLGHIWRHWPMHLDVRLVLLERDDSSPIQILVDLLRLLLQFLQLLLRDALIILAIIRIINIDLVIMIVTREEVREHLRNTTLHLGRVF